MPGVSEDTTVDLGPSALPPGPDLSSARVAQLWIERPVPFWEECAARYGEAFTVELGSLGTTVVFSHPDAIRQIFQLPPDSYEIRPFNDYYKSVMGDKALFLTDGPHHRHMRRALMPPLHRKVLETHGEAMRQHVREAVAEWPGDRPFSPRPAMHRISLEIMLGIIFGLGDDELSRAIARVFTEEIYKELGSWSAWTRFGHLQPLFRELIARKIRQRRESTEPGGTALFDTLVAVRDENGESLSDEEIQDHLFTMFVAGVDPTALSLTWLIYWTHQDPEVLARLRQEVADLGPEATPAEIVGLPYLEAACQETLRMYPIPSTPSGRKLLGEAEIGGRRYGRGVTLVTSTYLVHRRADLYPEPERFRPERFLERSYGPHEYFPFGGGMRTCIGASLATIEMKLVLAEILASRTLTPAHDGPVVPARHGTLLAPSDTLKFRL